MMCRKWSIYNSRIKDLSSRSNSSRRRSWM